MKKLVNFVSVILVVVCMLSIMACSGGGGGKQTPVDNCKVDTDGDGTPNCDDQCPTDPEKTDPGDCGCNIVDIDSDNDGVSNCLDNCDNSQDADGDGTSDCDDRCPLDANKTEPGIYGCGLSDTDSDGDGTPDFNDQCPTDPNKVEPGSCGCGVRDIDTDGDSVPDCLDDCDNLKDSDGDGTVDCEDQCPNDSGKIEPGSCGCGVSDVDTDMDSVPDCNDTCDDRVDTDGDGISDCVDLVNNDGSSIEAAITLIPDRTIKTLVGVKKFFKFSGIQGKYYDVSVDVNTGDILTVNSKRLTIFDLAGKYLAFKPGVADSSLDIYRWLCPANAIYTVTVESPPEESEISFDIKLSEGDTWVGALEKWSGIEVGDGHDRFEYDDRYSYGRSIAIDEIQNRTSIHSQYDFDWVFALVEEGKTYEFRVASILNADMAFSLHGPEGGDALVYVPHVSTSFTWTASFTDFILMRLVNWNAGEYGEYSFQIVELNQ